MRALVVAAFLGPVLGSILVHLSGCAVEPRPIEALGAEEAGAITVLFFGDSGDGHPLQYEVAGSMARVCERLGCDLGLMLGDNVYTAEPLSGGDDPWLEQVFGRPYALLQDRPGFRLYSVAGNHDVVAGLEAESTYAAANPLWEIPGLSYPVPGLPDWLHVFGLFTPPIFEREVSESQGEAMRDWQTPLREAEHYLCDETREGWKILFGHHPLFSSTHGTSDTMISRLLPVIERCAVDLYLSGHAHQQEHIATDAVDQLIQGVASSPRPTGGWFEDAPKSRFLSEEPGFGVLRITPESLWLNFFGRDDRVIYSWRLAR